MHHELTTDNRKAKRISTPMAMNSLLFVALFLAGLKVQLSEAKLLAITYGIVPCSDKTMIDPATSPPFPDAQVQLEMDNTEVLKATTDSEGLFAMKLDLTKNMWDSCLTNCKAVVTTPLAGCKPGLPASGKLTAKVELLGAYRVVPKPAKDVGSLIPGGQLLPDALPKGLIRALPPNIKILNDPLMVEEVRRGEHFEASDDGSIEGVVMYSAGPFNFS